MTTRVTDVSERAGAYWELGGPRLALPAPDRRRQGSAGLLLQLAQAGDEFLPAGRADTCHVVVALQGDLPGVAEHVEALVVEGGHQLGAARGGVAPGPMEQRWAVTGQWPCVVVSAGPGQLVDRRVDQPERGRLPLLGGNRHPGPQRPGQAGPADVRLAEGGRGVLAEGERSQGEAGKRVGVGTDVGRGPDRATAVARSLGQGGRHHVLLEAW